MRSIVFALALAACATAPTPEAVTADPVVAAERAFAARAGESGWVTAFREFTAPDGQIVQADIVSAPQSLAETPDDGLRTLFWQPAYAGIARSGDLGFTTGPVSFDEARTPRGQYFTVWRRQPDGSWKWIYDGGPGPVAEPGPIVGDDATVALLPVSSAGAGSPGAATSEVNALEARIGSASALATYLAADAHVYRTGRPRAYGGAASASNATFPSADVTYRLTRTEASSAGDIVFTLGHATWTRGGQERQGFFARIWQRRPEGWRIVYDQLVGRSPPPT
jgi:ketosteroid isomerase-like protein